MKSCLVQLAFCSLLLLLCTLVSTAQDTTRVKTDSMPARSDSSGRPADTSRWRTRSGLSALFADSAKLTSSDYQLQIEKRYFLLSNVDNKSDLGMAVLTIREKLADTDSVLAVLKDNVLNNSSALNLRNLQVFRTLLLHIQTDLKEHRIVLDSTEKKLTDLRNSLAALTSDTVLRQVWRDSSLRKQFAPQLKDMREVFRSGTSHLRESMATVNLLQTHTSSNAITTAQLLERVNNLLNTSAARIFGKEYNYLWEKDTSHLSQSARSSFEKAYSGERKA